MTEHDRRFLLEGVKPETINAINAVIDSKFGNPAVVREDPDHGVFVLDDAKERGHRDNTRIEIDNMPPGKLILFLEHFNEVTPRHKPSVLGYDYELDGETMTLSIGKDYTDLGPLVRVRLRELKSSGTRIPSRDEYELLYAVSDKQAQIVLASMQAMKIFIGR